MANVLIVGGTEEAQLILRGLLRLHQHRILGASLQRLGALELLRQTADPVLILDVDCPEPVWTSFAPEARAANPATRIVLLTPGRSTRLEAQARALGVTSLVRRPFAIQELLTAVGPPSEPPGPPSPPSAPAPSADEPGKS